LTDSTDAIQIKRIQFPVRLAFCVTVNKSQGQTIKKLGFYIDSPLFSHGHLYTAMSRVTNPKNLKIMLEKKKYKNRNGFFINNVVFKEVFNL
jgi:ATP-dependent DNA helicase PIF1